MVNYVDSAENGQYDDQHNSTEPDERSRLLTPDGNIEHELAGAAPAFPRHNMLLCAGFIGLLVLLECSARLQLVPLNQVLEDIICRRLHPECDTDCNNSEAVQAELALLRGWQNTLDLIPGVLTVIPYGFVADKYGRKFGLCLCILGITLSSYSYTAVCWWPDIFPVRMTWLSSLFTLIGGGLAVLMSLVFSALSDLAPDAYRSTTFFAISAAGISADLILSSIIPPLMNYNVWLPVMLGLGLYIPSILLSLWLPETLNFKCLPAESAPNLGEDTSSLRFENGQQEASNEHVTLRSRLREGLDKFRIASTFLLQGNWSIISLLLTILITTLGKMAHEVLLQFARKKFGWSWSKAGYLFGIKASVMLLLLLIILPAINYVLTKALSMRPTQKDLNIARASCLCLLLGNLIIGFSTADTAMVLGVIICSMGSAYDLTIRSLISQLVEARHRAVLFTTVAMLECLGAMIASPVLAMCFRVGLRLGGTWLGLPFWGTGFLLTLSLCVLYSIRF